MSKLELNIENEHSLEIPPAHEIEQAILDILANKGIEGEFIVDLKIVEASEIHALNKEYRKKDKPTDVLSFPIQDKVETANSPVLLGDIVVCPEMAEESVIELVKHSTLHLLGFHHPGD